jgi:hypothetical protein
MLKWIHSYIRATLITGSFKAAYRVGRPSIGRDMPWVKNILKRLK